MRKVGEFSIEMETVSIYSDDLIHFFDENGDKLKKNDLETWAQIINSPWSQDVEEFLTKLNCVDAYTPMNNNLPKYQTCYFVNGMESLSAEVYGYGDTPVASLQDCINHISYLQETYNKENIKF